MASVQPLGPPPVLAILCGLPHQEPTSHSYPTRFTKVLSRVSTMMLSPATTKGGTCARQVAGCLWFTQLQCA